MALDKLPDVAKNFYYPCDKCDRERYFRVLTHLSPTEAKIECEVCKTKRKLSIGRKSSSTKKSAARKPSKAAHEKIFVEWRDKSGNRAPEPYGVGKSFSVNTVIEHPNFGVGYVTTAQANKIEVVFADGVKNLIHNRS